jgi:hypothetical protein
MNQSKNQWKLLENANGIMFFGCINIVGTNPFPKRIMSCAFQRPNKNTQGSAKNCGLIPTPFL